VPHDVPPPGAADDAPRLEAALAGLLPRPPVVEGDDAPLLGGVPEGVEGGLLGAQARRHQVQPGRVDLDALGGELAHRLGRTTREGGLLPRAGRDPEHGRLVGLEADLRERRGVGGDPVAGLVVEEGVQRADLDHDPELAQVVLVALEGLLERLVALGVVGVLRVVGPPDVLLGDEPGLGEQHDVEVEQPLRLVARHRVSLPL
jgi:hypothetical protein